MSCLYAAARNEIQPTDKTGELLDVAYKAMATKPEDRYASVQDFQAAIREYQSHSESIVLSTRADEELTAGPPHEGLSGLFAGPVRLSGSPHAVDGQRAGQDRRGRSPPGLCRAGPGQGRLRSGPVAARRAAAEPGRPAPQADRGPPRARGPRRPASRASAAWPWAWPRWSCSRSRSACSSSAARIARSRNTNTPSCKTTIEPAQICEAGQVEDAKSSTQLRDHRPSSWPARTATWQHDASSGPVNEARTARQEEQNAAAASYRAQIGVAAERIANNSFLDAERLLDDYEGPGPAGPISGTGSGAISSTSATGMPASTTLARGSSRWPARPTAAAMPPARLRARCSSSRSTGRPATLNLQCTFRP